MDETIPLPPAGSTSVYVFTPKGPPALFGSGYNDKILPPSGVVPTPGFAWKREFSGSEGIGCSTLKVWGVLPSKLPRKLVKLRSVTVGVEKCCSIEALTS